MNENTAQEAAVQTTISSLVELHLLVGGLVVLALEDGATVLVQLELGDHHVRRVDAHVHGGTVGLLTGDTLDVDDVLLAIHLDDLALATTVDAADHEHLVVLADRHGLDVVLLGELLVEVSAHDLPPDAGRSSEVRLTRLTAGCRDSW